MRSRSCDRHRIKMGIGFCRGGDHVIQKRSNQPSVKERGHVRINCVFVSDCNYPVSYRGWFCCGSTSLPEVSENGTLSSATDVIPVTSAASVSPFMAVTVAEAAVPVDVQQEDGLLTSMSDLHWFTPRLYSWLGRRDSLLIKAFLSFSHEPFLPPPPPSLSPL